MSRNLQLVVRPKAVTLLLGALVVVLLTASGALSYFTAPGLGRGTAAVGDLSQPTAVTVGAPGVGTAPVSWTGSSTGGGSVAPEGYLVTRTNVSTGETSPACGTSSSSLTTVLSCIDGSGTPSSNTPVPGGTYRYGVTAVFHSWRSESAPSDTVNVTGAATCPAGNEIACENQMPGNPESEWQISGDGDSSIQGFATQMSVDQGQTVRFKVTTDASAYRLDIYRLGWYGGDGARKVATVQPSAMLPQDQPACLTDATTKLLDCGNWAVSASWAVPADAVSGIYIAQLVRSDTGGASHVPFIVRDDDGQSDLLFETSDTAWQAYNSWGGNSLYTGATKVSYNRPFNTRATEPYDNLFNSEYPMVRWLERNGYDVSYISGSDGARAGAELLEHKTFMSVGHDEYWSGGQRANVEAARAAGVNLAFFSGNELFWKTRWEPSTDASNTDYRTLVTYKETQAGAKTDPLPNVWTGTWRDARFSPPADGGRPENGLTGTIYTVNGYRKDSIAVPAADGKLRLWRNTPVANLAAGQTATMPSGTLGYEWDEDLDNGARPAGAFQVSDSGPISGVTKLQDEGSNYAEGTARHHLVIYRHSSGALVFGAGTVQWSWGLDDHHDAPAFGSDPLPADARMQQATVNLFADMGAQPATRQPALTAATATSDTTPPSSMISSPSGGANVPPGTPLTISGTASDTDGEVGGVEVSVDDGQTWHPASGRASWSYNWTPTGSGEATIKTRAVDDSGRLETPRAGVTVTIGFGPSPGDEGAGGPILVVTGGGKYDRYYGEILRAEGLVEFKQTSLTDLRTKADPAAFMADYKVVLLAESNLDASGEDLFRSYVNGGGSLIAMKPDHGLGDVVGLDFNGIRPERLLEFFAVDASKQPGSGIYGQSLQYHGDAENYSLNSASSLASLYTDIDTASSNPAATLNTFGDGKAATFAFDVARSIVLSRQGNPAWKDIDGCDGLSGYRPMDMFVQCNGDPYLAPQRVGVPQADELQRFLANLVQELTAEPLPRLWYLPAKHKAIVVNTGDGEDNSGSDLDAVVQDANSYGGKYTVYFREPGINGTTAEMEAAWRAAGNETGVHAFGNGPQDYDTMRSAYQSITSALQAKYGHGSRTARQHTIDWTGWSEMAEIEAESGTRLDTNYYHYANWLFPSVGRAGANGWFTGSGLPQRFSDANGNVLPIYQALTEWSDEWFADNGWTAAETLQIMKDMLASAQAGNYSAFVNNIHPVRYLGVDPITHEWANALWAYCRDNGIPMWSAEMLLDFAEAREKASFDDLAWNGSDLSFTFATPTAGQQLTLMVPSSYSGKNLSAVQVDGSPVAYTTDTIKGRSYALFTVTAASAAVVASYAVDLTPPAISAVGEQNVTDTAAAVQWTTDEPADGKVEYGTASGQLDHSKTSGALALSHSLQLTGLSPATTYFYKVTSADASGNPASSTVRSFTTPSASWQETSQADFADGTNAGTAVTATGGGAVELTSSSFSEGFGEPDGLPADWTAWPASGNLNVTPAWHVANGVLVHDLNENASTYHPIVPSAITPTGDVTITSRQRIVQVGSGGSSLPLLGFVAGGTDTQNYYIVQWFGGAIRIYHRPDFSLIGQAPMGDPGVGVWHEMKMEIVGTTMKVYVDGTLRVTATLPAYAGGKVGLLGYEGSLNEYDDVTISGDAYLPSGTYTSSVFDAGASALWGQAGWTADTPAGTSLAVSVRTGNTPTPDGSWSAFAPLTNGGNVGTSGRYAQYRAQLSSSAPTATPRLRDITLGLDSYTVDLTPPAISAISEQNVTDTAAIVQWTTDEPADGKVEYGTASGQLDHSKTSGALALSHSLQLTGLSPATTYFYKVTSADASGNPASSDERSFTTPSASISWEETSQADFADGTNAGTAVTATGGGAVELTRSSFSEGFGEPDGPASKWTAWPASGNLNVTPAWHVANGVLVHDLNENASTYHPIVPSAITPTGDVTITSRQRIVQVGSGGNSLPLLGFVAGGTDTQNYYIVQWFGSNLRIYRRQTGGGFTPIASGSLPGPVVGQWYDMKLEITGTTMKVYVDGAERVTASLSAYAGGKVGLLGYEGSLNEYDDVTISGDAYLPSGTYTSSVFDAGASALWGQAGWTADTPAGTSLAVSVRTGNTPTPDGSWSAFAPLTNGGNVGTSGRYAQYTAQLLSSAPTATPRLRDVILWRG